MRKIKYLFFVLLVMCVLYLSVAGIAWKFRNPKANDATALTHFNDVIHFRKLATFQ
jgi:hypothetical protein